MSQDAELEASGAGKQQAAGRAKSRRSFGFRKSGDVNRSRRSDTRAVTAAKPTSPDERRERRRKSLLGRVAVAAREVGAEEASKRVDKLNKDLGDMLERVSHS